jgi:hypothetical protein
MRFFLSGGFGSERARTTVLLALVVGLLGGGSLWAAGVDIAAEERAKCLTDRSGSGLRVLILCDSMGLNGFADELDASFRSCPGVERVHTIAACGTNPRTWMKVAPYAGATTQCGFLRIDSTGEPGGVKVVRDVYGVPSGNTPKGYKVPKIEDLVAEIQPDILIMQNGNNFFDLFEGSQADPEKSCAQIRTYMAPMRQWLATNAPSVRRYYWVSPPQAGSVSSEVQEAVYQTIRDEVEPGGTMVDSRQITTYPYSAQSEDKMHFWGDEAFDWGRDTFRVIARDLGRRGLQAQERVTEVRRAILIEEEDGDVVVKVKLEKMLPVPSPESFAPYGDLLVAGLYRVLKVKSGKYEEKKIVILHPAYIDHMRQDLKKPKWWQTFEFRVKELDEKSLWAPVRRVDDEVPMELFPYMLVSDEERHPNFRGGSGAE